tara:strand:- start:593 stop:2095 length:1503 start_codon:yes stop_codon:yes gene_type:complete
MAERKRRPPSSKFKPGTPHPTKAYTVRGYDGRWISTKAFNAAKRAKAKAAKGGALAKRTTSAVTKASNKAGELLKIKKGDKGIVRAVKDVYKLGKDTRKSANALYKAGKITREVYDKLVKGGKDFVGGVREAGKATRRAYEKTKPGGKIVRVSKDAPKFKYEALPKQKGGAIVKTKGSAVTKAKSTKGGKLTTTRKPTYLKDTLDKTAKKTASKTARRNAAEMKLTRAKKGSGPTLGKKPTVGQPVNQLNRAKRFVSKNTPKVVKGVKTGGKWLSKQAARTGVAGKVAGRALILKDLVDSGSDIVRGVGNVYRQSQNKPLLKRLNIGGYKAGTGVTDKLVDKQNARLKVKKSNKVKKTEDNTSQAKGWNARNLAKKKTQSEKKLANIPVKEGNATVPGRDGKAYRVNPDFGKKPGSTQPQVQNKNTKKEVTVGNVIGATAQPPKKRTTARDRMRAKNVKIHGEKAVKKVSDYHKAWTKARKAGTLKQFKKKYPNVRSWGN